MFFDVKKKFLPLLCVVLLPSAARSMGSGDWGGWKRVDEVARQDEVCARLDRMYSNEAEERAKPAGNVSLNVKGVKDDVKALSGASASHGFSESSRVPGLGNAENSLVPAKEVADGSPVGRGAEVNKKMLIQGLIFTTVAVVVAVGLYKAYTWLRANNKQKNKKMIENMKRKKRENKEPLVVRIPRPVVMWRSDR